MVKCPKCGEDRMDDKAKYCISCGYPINADETEKEWKQQYNKKFGVTEKTERDHKQMHREAEKSLNVKL